MIYKSWCSLIFLSLFFPSMAFATLKVNLEVVHKRGMDKGLVLVSEFHSVEEVQGREIIELYLKHGIKITLKVRFEENYSDFGPADYIRLKGAILGLEGSKDYEIKKEKEIFVRLGQKAKFHYEDEKGQFIEISIRPIIH